MSRGIPSIHVVASSIPEAHYLATGAVFEEGMQRRTQYDRKNSSGDFIDPPSRDASALIEVRNPFSAGLRFPAISCCEIGAYFAEIMGAKDHLVVPFQTLKEQLRSERKLTAKEWPYTYHERLTAYPCSDGTRMDQMGLMIDRLAEGPITRRAVATTRVPEIDCLLKDDQPCLGEVQLRCSEVSGQLYLDMSTRWRSRDLFKAWHDNVLALTFWQQILAEQLGKKMGRKVFVGAYRDFSESLHIYGQDIASGGSAGMTAEQYLGLGLKGALERATSSQSAGENRVIPELSDLLAPQKIEEWHFGEPQINLIKELISKLESGKLAA